MHYSPITCPHCAQQTQFDFDSESCYCLRCGQLILRESPAASGALIEAADRAFLNKNYSSAQELYSTAIACGSSLLYLQLRKAICEVQQSRTAESVKALIALYAQFDGQLQSAESSLHQRQALAQELAYFLEASTLPFTRDSAQSPFLSMNEARSFCLDYCATFELLKELYKYVPYDLLDQRESLSRCTQLFCAVADKTVYYYQGRDRMAAAIATATRRAAAQVFQDCAHDLAYIQSLRSRY